MNEGSDRIDYMESSDITEVHAAIKREHKDPSADVTPIPMWLTGVCGFAILWAGMYVGVFHGGFSPNVFDENQSSPLALFPPPKRALTQDAGAGEQSLAAAGKSVYAQCQACHQANGNGVPGQFPPLASSDWVNGGEKRLLAIILKGVQGPMTVAGKPFNGVMPPWEAAVTSKKIA